VLGTNMIGYMYEGRYNERQGRGEKSNGERPELEINVPV
jgi:hypothetical protein